MLCLKQHSRFSPEVVLNRVQIYKLFNYSQLGLVILFIREVFSYKNSFKVCFKKNKM